MEKKILQMPDEGEIINPQVEARKNFSAFTQSVAFQISLSKRMVDVLRAVRDHGFPHIGYGKDASPAEEEVYREQQRVFDKHIVRGNTIYKAHDFVSVIKALERRGLVICYRKGWNNYKKHEKTMELSLAGEIMCELLVEAGLIPAELPKRKVKNGHVAR